MSPLTRSESSSSHRAHTRNEPPNDCRRIVRIKRNVSDTCIINVSRWIVSPHQRFHLEELLDHCRSSPVPPVRDITPCSMSLSFESRRILLDDGRWSIEDGIGENPSEDRIRLDSVELVDCPFDHDPVDFVSPEELGVGEETFGDGLCVEPSFREVVDRSVRERLLRRESVSLEESILIESELDVSLVSEWVLCGELCSLSVVPSSSLDPSYALLSVRLASLESKLTSSISSL